MSTSKSTFGSKGDRIVTLGNQHHEAVDPNVDVPRLMRQYERILAILNDGQWHTLHAIAERTGIPHGSVGSQIRNARVEGYHVEKRRAAPGAGTWEYRLTGVTRAAA